MRAMRRCACLVTLAALVATLPAAAGAAVKRIKPNDLVPSATQQVDSRFGILNSGGGRIFWALLKLPVGAKITGVSYRRIGSAGPQSNVAVQRVQPGKDPAWQEVYNAISADLATGTGITVNGAFVGATKKVQAGWDYFVLTYTESGAAIGDITVKYETP